MEDNDKSEERIAAVLGSDTEVSSRNLLKWRDHLLGNFTLPISVMGSEAFPWEEPYMMGGWSDEEYEKMKKDHPSYTDLLDLIEIEETPINEDLVAIIKRISDNKVFEIGLSWLEVCKGGKGGKGDEACVENYEKLDDYSVWHCNY